LAQQETREKLGLCLGNASGSWGGKAHEIFGLFCLFIQCQAIYLADAPLVRLHDLQMSVLTCTRKE
jgi:hypothetical protein